MLHAALMLLLLPVPEADLRKAEAEVREAVTRFNAAYLANDMAAYWPFYDPSLTQWWPEGRVDLPAYHAQWTKLLKDGGKVLENEITDLVVQVAPSADAAVASYAVRVATRQPDGKVTRERVHETDVWFKKGGVWRVVHLHYSPKPEEQPKP
ncbi:MAG TPA: nuclear transport factor 2 family protein [Vicinamibacteria bacterium]|nr:nuclear transport factor 2 family protein [Vicinamibacteria bacterium]